MPRGVSNNITNISGIIRNNAKMYGRVVNGQQFISTVKKGWGDNPTDEQKILRVKWRIYNIIFPLYWIWLQGFGKMLEAWGYKTAYNIQHAFEFIHDEEGYESDVDNDFPASLRFDWEHKQVVVGSDVPSEHNPPNGGYLQWMFEKMQAGDALLYGKKYKSLKMMCKAYLWGEIARIEDGVERAWNWRGKFLRIGYDWFPVTPKGYDELIRDTTPRGFLKNRENGDSGGSTPPGEGEEGGTNPPPGGGDEPDNPGGGDTPEPEPTDRKINEYLDSADWLQGDGSSYIDAFRPIIASNTFKCSDVTLKAKIRVSDINPKSGSITNICGASGSFDGVRYRLMNIALSTNDDGRFSVGYFGDSPNTIDASKFVGSYSVGDTLTIEANGNSLIVNGVPYSLSNDIANTHNLSMIIVFSSGTALGGNKFAGDLAFLEYHAGGALRMRLIPAVVTHELPASMSNTGTAQPVGSVGLWDSVNSRFLTSSTANYWEVLNDTAAPLPDDGGGSTPPAVDDGGSGSTPPAEDEGGSTPPPSATSRPGDANSKNFEYRAIDTGIDYNGKRIWISDRYAGADSPTTAGEWYDKANFLASDVVKDWYGEGWQAITKDIMTALDNGIAYDKKIKIDGGWKWEMAEDVYFMGYWKDSAGNVSEIANGNFWGASNNSKMYNILASSSMSWSEVSGSVSLRLVRAVLLV